MFNFLNQSATSKLIKSIATRAKNVERDIHIAACSTLAHTRDHGDYTGAVALMNALPKGQRVKGLAVWYKHHTSGKLSMRQDKSKGNILVASLAKDRTPEDFLVDEAVEITFADFTVEPEPKEITVDRLVKYLEGIATNDEVMPNGKPKVTPEAFKAAVTALKALEATKAA